MIDLRIGRARLFITSLAVLGVTACSDLGGPPPGHVEDPGILLVPVTTGTISVDPVWTSDGSEVVYLSGDGVGGSRGLNGVSISTHASRRIHSSSSLIFNLVRGRDGERIYFTTLVADGLGGQRLEVARLHPVSGAFEALTTVSISGDDHLEVSPDEKFLVIGSTFHNLQTGISTALPRGRAAGFSPDGSQLLFYVLTSGSTPSPVLISTANASSQALHSTGDYYLAHRWVGNVPQLLKSTATFAGGISTTHLSELDAFTGTARDIAQFTSHVAFVRAAWSPDGNTLAAWIPEGDITNRTDRTTLYVIRSGGVPAVVGSIHGSAGSPVFSPNGTAIVYFYYGSQDYTGSLYVKTGI